MVKHIKELDLIREIGRKDRFLKHSIMAVLGGSALGALAALVRAAF